MGGLPYDKVRLSMRLFAEKVMPRFKLSRFPALTLCQSAAKNGFTRLAREGPDGGTPGLGVSGRLKCSWRTESRL